MRKVNVAFSAVRWSLVVNLVQKIVTFCLNQALISWTSPEVFGMASIQLELVLSTLLFLSREGIRLAALKVSIENPRDHSQLVNISWIPAMVLAVVVASVVTFYVIFLPISPETIAVFLYCVGALLESIGEPWRNITIAQLNIAPRLQADMIAVIARSITTFLCIAYFEMGIIGFGVAQVAFGACHAFSLMCSTGTCLIGNRRSTWRDFIPQACFQPEILDSSCNRVKNEPNLVYGLFDRETYNSARTATFSSLLKHGLNEADKIVLSICSTSYDQGLFAVANNYGSLVARVVFLPVEDSTRLAFSKLSTDAYSEYVSICERDDRSKDSNENEADIASTLNSSSKGGETTAVTIVNTIVSMNLLLSRLLRAVALFGLIFPLFGPPYTAVLVRFVLGAKWRGDETVRILALFCLYLFIMALNGVSEAFVFSVAAPEAFARLNRGMVVSSCVYFVLAVPLVNQLGTSGVVIGACVSMTVRNLFNLAFISEYFRDPLVHAAATATSGPRGDSGSVTVTSGPRGDSGSVRVVACTSDSHSAGQAPEKATKELESTIKGPETELSVVTNTATSEPVIDDGDVRCAENTSIKNSVNPREEILAELARRGLANPVSALMPSVSFLSVAVAAAAVAWGSAVRFEHSSHSLRDAAVHVGVGAVAGLGFLAALYLLAPSGEVKSTMGILRGRLPTAPEA